MYNKYSGEDDCSYKKTCLCRTVEVMKQSRDNAVTDTRSPRAAGPCFGAPATDPFRQGCLIRTQT